MNMRWDLSDIYTSFDSKEYLEDLAKLDEKIEEVKNFANGLNESKEKVADILRRYVELESSLEVLSRRLSSYAHLNISVDVNNKEANKYMDILMSKGAGLAAPSAIFEKWLGQVENLEAILEKDEFLKEYKFYFMSIKENTMYSLSDREEEMIAKMRNTGSKAWSKLQGTLTSKLLVDIEIDGEVKKLPLTVVRNMAYDKNPEVRKKAYEAELKAYEKINESIAAALNGIKGEVITECELRGYESPLQKTLITSRMDKETLDAMIGAMKEYLPAFHKYFRKKAELLGHENGLPFYDLFAPLGEVDMTFTYEEAQKFIVDNFRLFSEELSSYAKHAFESNWVDAEPREGKRGGAFCSNLHFMKQSRFMANYNGSFSNMTTLAHELGHGFHGYCLREQPTLNSHYPMPIAETASIFCETIVTNAALKSASKEEAFVILENEISGAAQVIVDILSRYIFETNIFEERKNGSISVSRLKEIMMEAQKEAYGEGLDAEVLHPYMWINKSHYYSAGLNFYNFPYAYGLLFTTGLYAEYLNRGETFVAEYKKLLSETGKNDLVGVAKMMNIDIHSMNFWRNSLKLIEEKIEMFVSMK